MQRPGEPGAARFGQPEGCADHRPHRYRSFMIEEILTEPPGPKGAAPAAAAAAAGELLKFGVQALLAARPFHSHLGTCSGRRAAAWAWREGGSRAVGLSAIQPLSPVSGATWDAAQRRPQARLFAHSNRKVEGACEPWATQKPGLVSSGQARRELVFCFRAGFEFSNGVIGQSQEPDRARIPMVDIKSIYRALWIKMTSNQGKPEFRGRVN